MTKQERLRHHNALIKYKKYIAETYGIDKSMYFIDRIKINSKPRRIKKIKLTRETEKTICIYKFEGEINHIETIRNPFVDEDFGPIGEKIALKRMMGKIKKYLNNKEQNLWGIPTITMQEAKEYIKKL